jgi:F-type H+-transporting ATPase subunit delta
MSESAGKDHDQESAKSGANREISRRYGEALVSAAQKEAVAESVLNELAEIDRDVLRAYPQFAQILASPRVSTADKDRMLTDLFESRASSLVTRFLRVLNRHERLALLADVIREAHAVWDERNHRVKVKVVSAVPLEETQLNSLRDRLKSLTGGATPILNLATDPGLIGGLVVQIGDLRYDASVKSHLVQLRQRLIEGKTHEIQSRRDQFSHSA